MCSCADSELCWESAQGPAIVWLEMGLVRNTEMCLTEGTQGSVPVKDKWLTDLTQGFGLHFKSRQKNLLRINIRCVTCSSSPLPCLNKDILSSVALAAIE